MSIREKFEAMKKSGVEVPRPLEVLGGLDEKLALAHMDSKAATIVSASAPALEWLANQPD